MIKLILGPKFRPPDGIAKDIFTNNCTYPHTNETGFLISKWMWEYDGELTPEIPRCNLYCLDEPKPASPPNVSRYWDAKHWADSTLYYQCHKGISTV